MIAIRPAIAAHVSLILQFIRDLAGYVRQTGDAGQNHRVQ